MAKMRQTNEIFLRFNVNTSTRAYPNLLAGIDASVSTYVQKVVCLGV